MASLSCITCSNPIQDPPELHRLEDGTPCPACRDRALETVPPALPRFAEVDEEQEEVVQGELFDEDGDLAG